MVQIIDEYREPSTSEKFGRAFSNAGQTAATLVPQLLMQKQGAKNENEAIRRLIGEDLAGIQDPALKKIVVEEFLKNQGAQQKQMMQEQEKIAPFQAGLETIQRMRSIRQKGRLGRGSGAVGFFGGQTGKDRGEYSQLGKSLISLSSNIPIRNKAEFEALAEHLYDPSVPDSEAEGILDAMESIIQRSLGEKDSIRTSSQSNRKEKPPLTSFFR
jgi:hypothetical protein